MMTVSITCYITALMVLDQYYLERRKISRLFDKRDVEGALFAERFSNHYPIHNEESLREEYQLVFEKYNQFPISILTLCRDYRASITSYGDMRLRTNFNYGEVHQSLFIEDIAFVKTIIENVSFHVDKNQCFGLIGLEGSGKTTLLDTLVGKSIQTYGKIYYDGVEIDKISKLYISYCNNKVFNLWNELTLEEHLKFYLFIKGYPTHQIQFYMDHFLRFCHLESYQHQLVSTLNPTIRREFNLLLALSGYSKYVILDEPTYQLNPLSKQRLWKLIREIKSKGQSSIIIATDDLEEAMNLCDRVSFLRNGILNMYGEPEEVTKNAKNYFIVDIQTDYIVKFINEVFNDRASPFYHKNRINEFLNINQYRFYIEDIQNIEKYVELLEMKKREERIIEDYTIYNPNLKHSFNLFMKTQRNFHL